jgi:two-component system chemotaxis response regulator CheY
MAKDLAELSILVVDDEQSVQRLVRLMLNDMDISQVQVAKDGRAALDLLNQPGQKIDVIVCDWNMPRMSGLELLKQLRSVSPQMRFIMLTGRNDVDSVRTARDHGVDSYLLKPFSAEQLRDKLLRR